MANAILVAKLAHKVQQYMRADNQCAFGIVPPALSSGLERGYGGIYCRVYRGGILRIACGAL